MSSKIVIDKPLESPSLQRELAFFCYLSCGVFFVFSLISYHSADPAWSHVSNTAQIHNSMGKLGALLADGVYFALGYGAFIFPVCCLLGLYRVLIPPPAVIPFPVGVRFSAWLVALFALCGLFSLYVSAPHLPNSAGGVLGQVIATSLLPWMNVNGTTLSLLTVLILGITIALPIYWLSVLELVGQGCLRVVERVQSQAMRASNPPSLASSDLRVEPELNLPKALPRPFEQTITALDPQPLPIDDTLGDEPLINDLADHDAAFDTEHDAMMESMVESMFEPSLAADQEDDKRSNHGPKNHPAETIAVVNTPKKNHVGKNQGTIIDLMPLGDLPPVALLDSADPNAKKGYSKATLAHLSTLLEEKLQDFGIKVEVVGVLPGPVITRFEIQPAPGIKVSRISGLVKDLARSLAVYSVRVVEVIPGKPVIGIEIPNQDRQVVQLGAVLESAAFQEATSPLSLALGDDISGQPVVVDLAKMPHLLVAGTTGSGKSVGLNAMLLSLLLRAKPDEVRLIMVDPKMLELSIYEGIPHLLTPVVTDMKEAANALRWCVGEMERRYRLMASLGVRNLKGFNRKVQQAQDEGHPISDPLYKPVDANDRIPELSTLPYIVVVIDELADMMMIVGKKVEELIARIAQKARASGIHLILATQRPSVDVITGLIKANVPTRIAFQVSSKIDSRTIIDQGGAEQLLGYGDMLYLPPGSGIPNRVHGAFVDDDEVHRVVDYWKRLGKPDYVDDILDESGSIDPITDALFGGGDSQDPEHDEFYDQAVAFITDTRRASISSVQRKFRIGYNRAARLIEAMEAAGVVSAMSSNGQREVLAGPAIKD